jgi:hypothetical protein
LQPQSTSLYSSLRSVSFFLLLFWRNKSKQTTVKCALPTLQNNRTSSLRFIFFEAPLRRNRNNSTAPLFGLHLVTMAVRCAVCRLNVTATNSVPCVGPCQRTFHFGCTELDENAVQMLKNSANLCFKCDPCSSACYKPLEDKIDKLENELAALKLTVTSCLGDPLTSKSATTSRIQPARMVKKTANIFNQQQTVAQTPPPLDGANDSNAGPLTEILGTGPTPANICLAEPKFWLYLANLDPNTDNSDLKKYLATTFGTENIKCVKLLPEGRNANS